MNSEDYIRKAVELADGFEPEMSISWGHGEQMFRDALAAQLVRQVDAIWGLEFTQDKWKSEVYDFRDKKGSVGYYAERTPILHGEDKADRTLNTIKAIVDSGVLECLTIT